MLNFKCNVGDTVYLMAPNHQTYVPREASEIKLDGNGVTYALRNVTTGEVEYFHNQDFGTRVFTSRTAVAAAMGIKTYL